MLFEWDGRRLIGHDGSTLGQNAFLRIVPESRTAVCLLTNGQLSQPLYVKMLSHVLHELTGVVMPRRPEPSGRTDIELARYAGTYQHLGTRFEVEEAGGALRLRSTARPASGAEDWPVQEGPLQPVDERRFVFTSESHGGVPAVMVFAEFDDDGRPRGLHSGGRAARRVS